jgi:7-carboxy-7-deazaguanine synthase
MSEPLFIHEIFPSFQGEGILAGVPQVFVRLSGCNLRCRYCDTPESRERVEICTVYGWSGERTKIANPVDVAEGAQLVRSLWGPEMHSVSLTGGEPLLQAYGLAQLLPRLKQEGMGIYLETNGTLGNELEPVLPWIDHIAMDVKLPSTQEGGDLMGRHHDFLARTPAGKAFLKVVVDASTGDDELESACRNLCEPAGGLTLVLQPATPPHGEAAMTALRAYGLYLIAAAFFRDVRVIPQMHRAWGVK